ncbi:hypothetical protein [Nonomuraea sp. NPDC049646]|uniref:hypothetical protein n=1 Tax=unclassified Nonomuraea TaxID=2593643 RepID=UPI00378D4019
MSALTAEGRRRLQNIAATWNPRMQAAKTDAEMAKVCFDRAKAAAAQAKRSGSPRAMLELAELLATWAAQQEEAEARRRGRHAS